MSGHQPPRGGNRGRYGRNTPDPSRRPYNQPQHQQNNNAPNQQPHYPGYVHFNQYQPPTNPQYYGTGYEGFTTQPAAVNPSMYPPQQQQYNEPGYPGYAGQYVQPVFDPYGNYIHPEQPFHYQQQPNADSMGFPGTYTGGYQGNTTGAYYPHTGPMQQFAGHPADFTSHDLVIRDLSLRPTVSTTHIAAQHEP
jgi:hypothetical protein